LPLKAIAEMNKSSQLFEAYLHCPTKCWLQSRGETVSGNMYAEFCHALPRLHFGDGRLLLDEFLHPILQLGSGLFPVDTLVHAEHVPRLGRRGKRNSSSRSSR
jgi:hypothetical protein